MIIIYAKIDNYIGYRRGVIIIDYNVNIYDNKKRRFGEIEKENRGGSGFE